MKVIALLPVKNESWILKTTIPQIKKFADEILCLDGGSEDNTVMILESFGAKVRKQKEKNTNFSSWRKQLLYWAREEGATHLLWIDADECPTTNFLEKYKDILSKMKPGQKLSMQWLCLWKSPYVYRDDKSVWSNLYKDFIFCDDGVSDFDNTALHEGRTPGPNTKDNNIRLPVQDGAILHFQFVPFERFQIKQAFQRCRELYLGKNTPRRINHRYSPTLDSKEVFVREIPKKWIDDINYNNIDSFGNDYYLEAIMKYFNKKGINFFEPLEIWHVPELFKIFMGKYGRKPIVRKYPKIIILLNQLKNAILK